MFRKTAWRKAVSDAVSWHQDQALSTTLFILKEYGPTGFLLKEDGEHKNYKVCLGDPHTCTCAAFQMEKDLCKHICWILMRKFRLPRDHEYCFQPGLVDRQISEVLQGLYRTRTPHPADDAPSCPPGPGSSGEDDTVRQKAIEEDDICPICQEELMKKRLPVTYCRFGCGNNVHISCMKKLADYQIGSETEVKVKCPLCREDFCEQKLLLQLVKTAGKLCTSSERERLDKHLGIPCNNCRICPIVGKCFKCIVCSYFHLCEKCYKRSCHHQHSFTVRAKRNQPWLPVEQNVDHQPNKAQKVDSPLMHSNSTNAFGTKVSATSELVPEHVLKSLPVIRLRQSSNLLEVGMQCRFCLQSFSLGQHVTTLPCRHKFHSGCIKAWLRQSVCCPLDWYSIYNPLTWNSVGVKAPVTAANCSRTTLTYQQQLELFIPGFSLLDRTVRAPAHHQQSADRSEVSTAEPLDPLSLDSHTKGTQNLGITSTGFRMNSLGVQCRESSRSSQRCSSLGRVLSVSDTRRRQGVKTSLHPRPARTARRPEGSERTQLSFFPELNQHISQTQPKSSGLHVHVRGLRLQDGKTRSPRSQDS